MTDELDARDLIIGLRGGIPETCDFCGMKRAPEEMHPEETGEWVCMDCLKRWARQDEIEARHK